MQVDSQILELADPLGPFGARGVAEMPFITYAPALTAAVYDATGVWFDTFAHPGPGARRAPGRGRVRRG